MFIETERTPNPATVKFLPGRAVMRQGVAEFKNADAAAQSPLAQRLFAIDGVESVFLGSDFISVTKKEGPVWTGLKTQIMAVIMEHFTSGQPAVEEGGDAASGHADGGDDELTAQIKELLDTRVRPAVAMDGGDVVFDRFEEGIVYLKMRGACSGCPSATATLKNGIENMLRHYVPEILEVRAAE